MLLGYDYDEGHHDHEACQSSKRNEQKKRIGSERGYSLKKEGLATNLPNPLHFLQPRILRFEIRDKIESLQRNDVVVNSQRDIEEE